MGMDAIKISVGLIVISLIVYFIYARKNKRQYALQHIVEKYRNKDLTSDGLEDELSEIVLERDNIVGDEFDKLISAAPVIDLDRSYKLNKIFQIISEKVGDKVDLDIGTMASRFMKREQEGSTVLISTVAVPHIFVDKKNIFVIVLLRCNSGIRFSNKYKNVKTVIAVIGSKDMRTQHLKALAAIAQVIQDKEFDKKWEKAETAKNLRDIFLLSDRRRDE